MNYKKAIMFYLQPVPSVETIYSKVVFVCMLTPVNQSFPLESNYLFSSLIGYFLTIVNHNREVSQTAQVT
jgi:hypothetical protein